MIISSYRKKTKDWKTEAGFTLLEALVATTLLGLILSMVVGYLLTVQRGYFTDIVRTRINSNLRSAMDILSMNIRQAGENLQSSFPAVVVTDGGDDAPDTLSLRRSLVPEVLTLCTTVGSGATQIFVSSESLSNSQCVPGNVEPLHEVFEEWRSDNDGSIAIFIFDRSTNSGQFIEHTGGGSSSGQFYLTVSGLTDTYSALASSIYLLEEYAFELNADDKVLDVYIDGDETERAVAFQVSDFEVKLEMDDGSVIDSLEADDAYDWKNLVQVQVTLSGEDTYKNRTLSSTISAEYFPRNVLSYDG